MRPPYGEVEKKAQDEIVQKFEDQPVIILRDLGFDGPVTVEYPDTHSLVIVHCNFGEEPVVIKVATRPVSRQEVEEVVSGLRKIEGELKTVS